jgi:hypothetical protein
MAADGRRPFLIGIFDQLVVLETLGNPLPEYRPVARKRRVTCGQE